MLFPALQAAPRRWLLYPSLTQQRLKQESFRNCALKLAYPVLVSNAVIQGTLKRRYRFLPLHRRGEERRGEEALTPQHFLFSRDGQPSKQVQLKVKLQRKLKLPFGTARSSDLAEINIVKRALWRPPRGRVCRVERVKSELKALAFRNGKFSG